MQLAEKLAAANPVLRSEDPGATLDTRETDTETEAKQASKEGKKPRSANVG